MMTTDQVRQRRFVIEDVDTDGAIGSERSDTASEAIRLFKAANPLWRLRQLRAIPDAPVVYEVPVDPADATICEACE